MISNSIESYEENKTGNNIDILEYHVTQRGVGQAREGFTELKDKRKRLLGYEVRDVHSRQGQQVQRP